MAVIGIEIFAKSYSVEGGPSAAGFLHCLKEGCEGSSGRCESMLSSVSDFLSLFLQAFQSTATSLPGPRSGNPGYIVGKPLLALTGDISHSVSFLGLSGLLQTNEESCSC